MPELDVRRPPTASAVTFEQLVHACDQVGLVATSRIGARELARQLRIADARDGDPHRAAQRVSVSHRSCVRKPELQMACSLDVDESQWSDLRALGTNADRIDATIRSARLEGGTDRRAWPVRENHQVRRRAAERLEHDRDHMSRRIALERRPCTRGIDSELDRVEGTRERAVDRSSLARKLWDAPRDDVADGVRDGRRQRGDDHSSPHHRSADAHSRLVPR